MVEQERGPKHDLSFHVCVWPVVVCVLALALGSARSSASAQKPETIPEIWKGIFTDAQVDRGKAVFRAHCASCHDPAELGEAPLLSGDTFMRNWEGHNVGRLFSKILEQMPANNVESVTVSEKLDVLTYILEENGFPSGASELTGDLETLARIQIVPEGEPGLPRTGAMVQAVGCLRPAEANEWVLASSTQPAVTTLAPPTAADSKEAATKALGTYTVRLLHVTPSPDPHKGHRIEVKGFLVRQGTDDLAINVVSLRSVASVCP